MTTSITWHLLWLMILGPLFLLGLLLTWRGWRGKAADDHPYCRGCGFDLTGLSADSAHCPECGRDLTWFHAVRHGRRVRRRGLLIAGALCLLLSLLPVGLLALSSLSNIRWQQHQPMWLLRAQAMRGQGLTMLAALKEIERRVQAGLWTAADLAGLVHHALRRQADLSATWEPLWGDLLETVEAQGLLNPQHWAQYLRQAVEHSVKLMVRPKVRVGDPIVYRMEIKGARVGTRPNLWMELRATTTRIGPLDTKDRMKAGIGTTLCLTSVGGASSTISLNDEDWKQIPYGMVPVSILVRYEIRPQWGGATLVRFEKEFQDQIEMVPSETVVVRPRVDPAQRSAMKKTIRVVRVEELPAGQLSVGIALEKSPVGLAYDVFVIQGQMRERLGGISLQPGGQSTWHGDGQFVLDASDKVEIKCVPSAQVAVSTVDLSEYWGEPMGFRDVPVRRLPPAPPPPIP